MSAGNTVAESACHEIRRVPPRWTDGVEVDDEGAEEVETVELDATLLVVGAELVDVLG